MSCNSQLWTFCFLFLYLVSLSNGPSLFASGTAHLRETVLCAFPMLISLQLMDIYLNDYNSRNDNTVQKTKSFACQCDDDYVITFRHVHGTL